MGNICNLAYPDLNCSGGLFIDRAIKSKYQWNQRTAIRENLQGSANIIITQEMPITISK